MKENTTLGSWLWKKILKQRNKARLFHKMEVRSGQHTSFWQDIWCPLGCLFQLLGPRGTIDLGISAHATVAEVLNSHRRRRHRVDLLNQIENYIDSARQGTSNVVDRSLWKQNDCYKSSFSSQKNLATDQSHKPNLRMV